MIEAVNASISTASSVRAIAQQVAASESFASNPAQIQRAAETTQYSSKYVQISPDIKPIFIVRDTNTGESIRQFPTESQIRAYQRAQQSRDAAVQNAQFRSEVRGTSTDEAAVLVESSVQFKEVRQQIKQSEAPPAPLPGQTKVEVKAGGDTGGDVDVKVPVKTNFSTDV